MIAFVGPVVEELNEQRCQIRIPYRYRNSNRLIGGVYFGALCVGADVAGGLMAFESLRQSRSQFTLAFKDFQAEFLKRAEGDTVFTCEEGPKIQDMVNRCLQSQERINERLAIEARVPQLLGDEVVARFFLTLSIRQKNS